MASGYIFNCRFIHFSLAKYSISLIEKEKRDPTFSVVQSIANALDIHVSKLVTPLEEYQYTHSLEVVLTFESNIPFLIGNSINNEGDFISWGLIVNLSDSGELLEEVFFKSNNEFNSLNVFYTKHLKQYLQEQRMRILMWSAPYINVKYENIKEVGVNWTTFKEVITTMQNVMYNSKTTIPPE